MIFLADYYSFSPFFAHKLIFFKKVKTDKDLKLKIIILKLELLLIMGFVGGLLPALRASRMNIIEALRAALRTEIRQARLNS